MEKFDVPQGTLDLLILTILRSQPLHGYGISKRLTELTAGAFNVNPGSLFPALYRLEQDGKLLSSWQVSDKNRKAKYYRLTSSGRRQLAREERRWESVSLAISSVLEGA